MDKSEIDIEEFKKMLNIKNDLDPEVISMIEKANTKYSLCNSAEQDDVILSIVKRVYNNGFSVSSQKRQAEWDRGWSENLNELNKVKIITDNIFTSLTALDPKYYRRSDIFRLNKDYVKSNNKNFEYTFYKILRHWLFKEFCSEAKSIYEYACGPCHNLVALSAMYKDKNLIGLDWAESSQEISKKLKKDFNININGYAFNFFKPNYSIDIDPNSLFLTIGGLEQVGKDHEEWLKYILEKKPKRVVQLECISDFYDSDNLADYMALLYHNKRGYLSGYYSSLLELEKQKKIKIIKQQRVEIGGLYHDGWSILVFDIL